ncbi:general secretion pathway protein GspB [Pseudoalteromonas sp. MMG010]|uniref:general secretion pathway protein GspB n=1 Tax=Pseudoalteromonas sp. MMG010 TaxID=2822685 RepID=UPI001B3A3CA9|nr:general secretion pathway protein GspB [Pseudoalteromonas sp. MMG010]MBQ4833959.1 general secretion pathway protein GspB [Pseudoalteromonas sp. MMG010]
MSILLDALKQSQSSDANAVQYDMQQAQEKQQHALKRYRQISFGLGASLVSILLIAGGYFTGQWVQQQPSRHDSSANVVKQTLALEAEPLPASIAKSTQSTMAEIKSDPVAADSAPVTTVVEQQPIYIQTENGLQQVTLNAQGEYIAVQTPLKQKPKKVTASKVQKNSANTVNTASNINNAADENNTQLDLSKYKVLGKPLTNDNSQARIGFDDPELETVPDKLKNAFAKAVQETQQLNDYEVTQGTKSSSRVQPIELLPDGLLRLIPPIKYQAHIYSSTPDKRWIKINGRELYEGDRLGALRVNEITPEQSVLNFDGYEFSLKALQDWPD